jgi:thiol-disulfide isomerase/thioredoxin
MRPVTSRMKHWAILIHALICLSIAVLQATGSQPVLYNPEKDDIELLDSKTFESVLIGSPKATIIEMFAHWCGHCQRFALKWIELAKDTKAWHEKVIRVAAIDCALTENDHICSLNNVTMYPTIGFFKPFANSSQGIMIDEDFESATAEYFMGMMIDFVENLDNRPAHFPILESYKYVVLNPGYQSAV